MCYNLTDDTTKYSIVERTINEFSSSRSVFFGNEAHETKSSVLHSRRTRSTFNITKFAKRVLFQVENAIKSVLLLPSLLRPAVLLTTTRGPLSPPVKCRLLSGSSSLVSSPSMPSPREPKLSPSTCYCFFVLFQLENAIKSVLLLPFN